MTKQDQYKKLKRRRKVLEVELITMEKCPLAVKRQKYLDTKTLKRELIKEMNELAMSVSNYEFYSFWV